MLKDHVTMYIEFEHVYFDIKHKKPHYNGKQINYLCI